uniref:Fibronectin type-III domain-containing protein n=1 Tax=Oncorhynchus tshawytscha TaxID=74940 RepID=A0AAZ3P6D4_ONCTS
MKMVGSWLFLLVSLQGYEAPSTPNVNCLIINLDYVNCTWSEQGSPEVNYTFFHKRSIKGNMEECTTYLQEKSYAVGCRLSYDKSDRYRSMTTKLVHQNNSYVQDHNLKSMVKLYPPVNLSVEMNKDPELNLYWNNSKNTLCIESEVRYRINSDKWKTSTPSTEQKYAVAFPLKSSRYEFQVRARVNDMCGESKFWSEWSQPIQWDSMKGNNITGKLHYKISALLYGYKVVLKLLSGLCYVNLSLWPRHIWQLNVCVEASIVISGYHDTLHIGLHAGLQGKVGLPTEVNATLRPQIKTKIKGYSLHYKKIKVSSILPLKKSDTLILNGPYLFVEND